MLESIENAYRIVTDKLFCGERKATPGHTVTVTQGTNPSSAVSSLGLWALHAAEVKDRPFNEEVVKAAGRNSCFPLFDLSGQKSKRFTLGCSET